MPRPHAVPWAAVERRANARYDIWLPVRIDSLREGVAVSHNASKTGMMVVTATQLPIGAEVTLSFRMPPDGDTEHEIRGTVVRTLVNDKDPDGLWPHALAIEFDDPIPELESLLQVIDSPAKSWPPPKP